MKKRWKNLTFIASLFLTLGVSLPKLNAQSDRGTITGTATDQTGAALVGVSVTVKNTETGVTSTTTTGPSGAYTISLLPTGTFQVTFELARFKTSLHDKVSIQLNQTARLDIVMEVGDASQTLEVGAEEPLLLSNTSELGTVVTQQQLQDLPLIGQGETRNPTFFMVLVPGVTGRGTTTQGRGWDLRVLSTTVNGSQSGSTEFHLDGSIIANPGWFSGDPRNVGFPPDAVGGFKLITLNAPAEYGRSGGGIASFTTRSGTNQLHGSVYEYFRNDVLDARGFFAAVTPANRQNEFGATVGGPIRKDKTFFYGWYNGFRFHRAEPNSFGTVPTDALKQGDFGTLLGPQIGNDALGRPMYQGAIYDPLTTRTVQAGQADPATGLIATAEATVRDPFPGNRIPSSRFDRVAQNILPLFPEPNLAVFPNNFLSQAVNIRQTNGWGGKIDHALTDNHKLFGSLVWSRLNTPGVSIYPGPLSGAIPNTDDIRIFRLGEDSILLPNWINHVAFGFNRWRFGTNPAADALGWPAKIGLTGVNEQGLFPGLYIDPQMGYGGTAISYGAQNNFDINDGLTWIKGKHTFKFGFEYLKMMSNDVNSSRDAGGFNFYNSETALPGSPPGATGAGMASFLLGQVDSGQVNVYTSGNYERSGYYAGYAQDDFKVTPKLILNLGLRYDLYRPTVDKWNHLAWVDRTAPNPALGGFPGTMVFATPDRRTGADQFNNGWAPRFGLAYSLDPQTVVRAGYGLFWAPGGYIRSSSQGYYIQGYNSSNYGNSLDGMTPYFALQDGWPAANFPAPPFIDPTYGFNGGVHILDRNDAHPPYLQNWTLNIQRQLPGQILLDIAYVGNKGTRLQSRLMPTNQLDSRYLSFGELLFKDITDPEVQALPVAKAMPIDLATGNHVPFAGFQSIVSRTTLGQALRPLPQYGDEGPNNQIRRFYEGTGLSTYHALQVKLNKRLSQGLTFLIAYTWSKTLTDAESQFSEFSGFVADPYNRKAEKSYSINDYPHNLVLNWLYELPFGPGKKFANAGGVSGKVVGGWKIAGIQQYQSGAPSSLSLFGFQGLGSFIWYNPLWPYGGSNNFMVRPNRVPGVNPKSAAALSGHFNPYTDSLINPAAFSDPAPFTFGNAPRTLGYARGFTYLNEDFSIIKVMNVNDRVSIEFRADFLNIFNRTVFGLGTGGDMYGSQLNNIFNGQSNYAREIQFGLKINY